MIGYAKGIREYRLCDTATETVVTSRDVVFDETAKYEADEQHTADVDSGIEIDSTQPETDVGPVGADSAG